MYILETTPLDSILTLIVPELALTDQVDTTVVLLEQNINIRTTSRGTSTRVLHNIEPMRTAQQF
jgi:hypothetical protein